MRKKAESEQQWGAELHFPEKNNTAIASLSCEAEDEPIIQMTTPITDETPEQSGKKLQELAICAQEKARDAYEAGQKCARENPMAVLGGALVIGLLIGLVCGSARPARKKDTSQAARELVDDIVAQIADRLPNFKKANCCSGEFLKGVGNKIKWW